MSTGIEWTDETWNPVTGCTKVSPGCANCYAEDVAKRFWKGRPFEDVRFELDRIGQPLRWRKPRRVFVNSMSDLFHENLPDGTIQQIFAVMRECPQHTFQVLTKRADRMNAYMKDHPLFVLPNVWLGVSVENQRMADARIPILIDTPAAVRFLSVEPLLDKVDLTAYLKGHGDFQRSPINWVIVGGESGGRARPCNIGWIERLVVQCDYYTVPCFVKQLGAKVIKGYDLCAMFPLILRHSKGGDIEEWPVALRVREFPKEEAHA